ncbi:hypothetical protein ASPZODRAFT_69292 [Penicilliopsis zonata CBS 506.65]|uniref:Uncharacterized protein n=1 Tax=Penicilliopsis zonata CBS 506.65 TaxID=1073090 RepID=A0A1L9SEC2_9EURO|nr:hypothetical protein ASPZODRAFT_69292 [Penicilliopsis zonata CBS 506.65]OJJ45580.1 hypothetical protein ASPZODRAFT_69292 [Penicilliopsis zonata CBS 506.65]
MDSPSLPMSSPTKALFPVSPERMNQQSIPNSPSLPSDLANYNCKTSKGLSDVQSRVAFLNSLSRGQSPVATTQTSSSTSAALQRAILGREEAESALRSVSIELSEAQTRERRISERLESLLEELQAAKERQAHERGVFEKEIRKARKEAFRAGSSLVRLQEELKNARNEAKTLKDEVRLEKEGREKAKQESFERAYALAGLTEELEIFKGKVRSLEASSQSNTLQVRALEVNEEDPGQTSTAESDSNVLTPRERRPKRAAEDLARSGSLESTGSPEKTDTPPKRQRLSEQIIAHEDQPETRESELENNSIIDELQNELEVERQLRLDAEDMIEFLKMECHFQRCSCRVAGHHEQTDPSDDALIARAGTVEKDVVADPFESHIHEHSTGTPVQVPRAAAEGSPAPEPKYKEATLEEPLITFSPVTGTFRTFPSPLRNSPQKKQEEPFEELRSPRLRMHTAGNLFNISSAGSPVTGGNRDSDIFAPFSAKPRATMEQTPECEEWPREQQITTMVPLRGDEESSPNFFGTVPGTPISREDALAQIRARREQNTKRSASANEAALRSGGMGTTPARGGRRVPAIQGRDSHDDGPRRDLSAPVRLFR